MSEGWADHKLDKLKNEILSRKQAEESERQRVTFIEARAENAAQQLLSDIQSSVNMFNLLRKHEQTGHEEIPVLEFAWIRAPYSVRVIAPNAVLEVSFESRGPSVKYMVSRTPETSQSSPQVDKKSLPFVRDGEHLALEKSGGGKLSVPAAADFLLDMII
jgi:hypothetical protein